MSELTQEELMVIRRAAEDAIHAANKHYKPFIDVVAHPLNIIALVDMAVKQAEIDHLNRVLDERTKEWLQAIELGDYFKNVAKPLKAELDQLQSQINDMAEVGLNQEKALMIKDKRIAELEAERKSLKHLFDSLISECELWGYESDQADKVVVLLKQAFVGGAQAANNIAKAIASKGIMGGVQMEKLDSYSPMANRHDT